MVEPTRNIFPCWPFSEVPLKRLGLRDAMVLSRLIEGLGKMAVFIFNLADIEKALSIKTRPKPYIKFCKDEFDGCILLLTRIFDMFSRRVI